MSSELKDARIEKPKLYDNGLSEIVVVYSVNTGLLTMAQWGKDGWWHGEGDETFSDVTHWYDRYPLPHDMRVDYSRYGGDI